MMCADILNVLSVLWIHIPLSLPQQKVVGNVFRLSEEKKIMMMIMLHRVSIFSLVSLWFLLLFSSLFYMEALRVGSLNINGGRDRNKRAWVLEVIK
jgi:hypothetical protein